MANNRAGGTARAGTSSDEQINIPSLVVILLLSGLAIRYLFFSGSSPGTDAAVSSSSSRSGASGRRAEAARARNEAAAERLVQMFPQIDRRTALWDLQRNGGNIQVTSERALAGRLETPPVTFQPPPPPQSSSSSPSPGAQQTPKPAERHTGPDLIARYNLQNKVREQEGSQQQQQQQQEDHGASAPSVSEEIQAAAKGKGWSSSRDERQSLLQKRRDDMILAARRKMEAKLKAEKKAGKAAE